MLRFTRTAAATYAPGFLPAAPSSSTVSLTVAERASRATPARIPALALRLIKLGANDSHWLGPLCDVLIDSVHRGASLGFLAPLSRGAAEDYWRGVLAQLGPYLSLWIAVDDEGHVGPETGQTPRLHGTVQLAMCPLLNAHHRGEVRGLMVHSQSRGRGVASRLMTRLECTAQTSGRQLLVLETPAGSQAEAVYTHLDWQRAGEIPAHSTCAEGRLHNTALLFKRLNC
ncbi:GNAT family N-acetyltransferase [Roseateles koreensis]|uniref:GNAT family N-acetyltransferase n=1 Tax=Roseateles koreensis TaxID=2987526 RepID=A0ABT5KS52_9BURK|nr:GNAT family N-acetyltransferase [Roseateles koreensis]MDC8784701.1 GNAT family N-acetyltransferase [Roseateles koreensis]